MSRHGLSYAPFRRLQAAMLLAVIVVLALPAAAFAFTAPTLTSPPSGATAIEGKSVTFDWSGTLQGDPAALDRSFFRVEVAVKDANPNGQQTVWNTLANFSITDAGDTTTNLVMGVPNAGAYEWRVCAWGVADSNVDPAVTQLSCSPSRALSASAAATTSHNSTVLTTSTNHTITTAPTHVTKIIRAPAPPTPAPRITRIAVPHRDPHGVARFVTTTAKLPTYGEKGSSSSVSLGSEGLNAGSNASGAGAFGFITSGLGTTIPGLPIPFWSLLIFVLVVPMTHFWRRSLLDMFEWPEEREARRNAVAIESDDSAQA